MIYFSWVCNKECVSVLGRNIYSNRFKSARSPNNNLDISIHMIPVKLELLGTWVVIFSSKVIKGPLPSVGAGRHSQPNLYHILN